MPSLHFFFLTQPLAISNQACASGIRAISPGHGTHTLAALVPQLLWNIDSVRRELLVKSWQIWLRFFRTGSSQLLLGSCTCWPEAQGVPVPTALHSCMFSVTKKRGHLDQGGGGGTLQSKVGPWYLEVGAPPSAAAGARISASPIAAASLGRGSHAPSNRTTAV